MATLKSITTITAGHPFREALEPVLSGEVSVVQMKDVDAEHGIDTSHLVQVMLTTKKKPDYLRQDDILFTSRGSHFFATRVDESLEHTVAAPKFFVLRVKTNQVIPAYVTWYINQHRAQRYFSQHVVGSWVQLISRQVLQDLPIDIPPLARQALIVNAHRCWLREKQLLSALEAKKTQLYAHMLDRAISRQ